MTTPPESYRAVTYLSTRQSIGGDTGRQEATELELLEPLANSILQHWDLTVLKEEFGDLDKLFMPDYNIAYAY